MTKKITIGSMNENGVLSAIIKCIALMSVVLLISQLLVAPENDHLVALIAGIDNIGQLAICVYGLVRYVQFMSTHPNHDGSAQGYYFISILNEMLICSIVLLGMMGLIGQYGDTTLVKANTDPASLAVDVIAVLLVVTGIYIAETVIRSLSLNNCQSCDSQGSVSASSKCVVSYGELKKAEQKSDLVNTAVKSGSDE